MPPKQQKKKKIIHTRLSILDTITHSGYGLQGPSSTHKTFYHCFVLLAHPIFHSSSIITSSQRCGIIKDKEEKF